MADSSPLENQNDEGPTSTPDWTRPFGVTTTRVDTRIPQQASGYPASWDYSSPPAEVVDARPNKESPEDEGAEVSDMEEIWAAYEKGY